MRGISILEIVLTMGVLTASFMALLHLFPAAMMGQNRGETHRRASLLASSMLEDYRNHPFSSLDPAAPAPNFYDVEMGGVAYHRALRVLSVTGVNASRALELEATVSYPWGSRTESVVHRLVVHRDLR